MELEFSVRSSLKITNEIVKLLLIKLDMKYAFILNMMSMELIKTMIY